MAPAVAGGPSEKPAESADQTTFAFKPRSNRPSAEQSEVAGALKTDSLAVGGNLSLNAPPAAGAAQHFVQVEVWSGQQNGSNDRRARDGRAPIAVMASFDLEQHGNLLRIVDADGSVYEGSVQEAQPAKRLRAAPAPNTKAAKAFVAPAERSGQSSGAMTEEAGLPVLDYLFHVEGLNRSLNRKVIISGSLFSGVVTNAMPLSPTVTVQGGASGGVLQARPSASGISRAVTAQAAPAAAPATAEAKVSPARMPALSGNAPGQVPALPLDSLRISGKAIIDGGGEIEINAVPGQNSSRPAPAPQ
jgi:hypothetical protein